MTFDCTAKRFGTVVNLTQKNKGNNFVDHIPGPTIFAGQ